MNKERQNGIDRIFIQVENKDKIPYIKLKEISQKVLLEFKHEIGQSCYLNHILHDACMHNDYKLVEVLIDAGADINYHDLHWLTPLQKACLYNSYECVKLLLELDAHIKSTVLLLSYPHESNDLNKPLLNTIEIKSTSDKSEIIMNAMSWARMNSDKRTVDLLMNYFPDEYMDKDKYMTHE